MNSQRGNLLLGILVTILLIIISAGAYFFFINTKSKAPVSTKPPSQVNQTYVACGCGCCGGNEPKEQCLYHSKGDDINKLIESDKKIQVSKSCALMGCSFGIKYRYCD